MSTVMSTVMSTPSHMSDASGSLHTSNYSLNITSFLPPHTDVNSPAPSLHIALALDPDARTSIVDHSAGAAPTNTILSALTSSSSSMPTPSAASTLFSPYPSAATLNAAASSPMKSSQSRTPSSPQMDSNGRIASSPLKLRSPAKSPAKSSGMLVLPTPSLDVDLAQALSKLEQSERDFQSAFQGHALRRSQEQQSMVEEIMNKRKSTTATTSAPEAAFAASTKRVDTYGINPNNGQPITPSSVYLASPKKKGFAVDNFATIKVEAEEKKQLAPSSISTSSHEFSASSRGNFSAAATSAAAAGITGPLRINGTTLLSSPKLLNAFKPSFVSVVDSSARKLFPASSASTAAMSGPSAGLFNWKPQQSSSSLHHHQSFASQFDMVASPSEEVAAIFRRSRATRGRDVGESSTATGGEQHGLLWHIGKERQVRLAHAIGDIQAMPSFTEYVAQAPSAPAAPMTVLSQPTNLTEAITKAVPPLVGSDPPPALHPHFSNNSDNASAIPPAPHSEHLEAVDREYEQLKAQYEATHRAEKEAEARENAERAEAIRVQAETEKAAAQAAEEERIREEVRRQHQEQQLKQYEEQERKQDIEQHEMLVLELADLRLAATVLDSGDVDTAPVTAQPPLHKFVQLQLENIQKKLDLWKDVALHARKDAASIIQNDIIQLRELLHSTTIAQEVQQPSVASSMAAYPSSTAQATRASSAGPSKPVSVDGEEEYRYRIEQFQAASHQQHQQRQHQTQQQSQVRVPSRSPSTSSRTLAPSARARRSPSHSPSSISSRVSSNSIVQSKGKSNNLQSQAAKKNIAPSKQRVRPASGSRQGSIVGESEFLTLTEHERQQSMSSSSAADELQHESVHVGMNHGSIQETSEHEAESRDGDAEQGDADSTVLNATATAATTEKTTSARHSPTHHLPLSSREVRALVRSEVLGPASTLREGYTYLPAPSIPIQLTRTQMLQQAAKLKMNRQQVLKERAMRLAQKAYPTVGLVRRNIDAVLEEQTRLRLGAGVDPELRAQEEEKEYNSQLEKQQLQLQEQWDEQKKLYHRRHPESNLIHLPDDTDSVKLEHLPNGSGLHYPVYSPSKHFVPPTNPHRDYLQFDPPVVTQRRHTPIHNSVVPSPERIRIGKSSPQSQKKKPQQQLSTSILAHHERHESLPSSSSMLLSAFGSDAEIENHMQQIFASAKLQLNPIVKRNQTINQPVQQVAPPSQQQLLLAQQQPQSSSQPLPHDSELVPVQSYSPVVDVDERRQLLQPSESGIMKSSEATEDDQYEDDDDFLQQAELEAQGEIIATTPQVLLKSLSEHAIAFPTVEERVSNWNGQQTSVQSHVELRPIGVILAKEVH